jgi:hypothetical protein
MLKIKCYLCDSKKQHISIDCPQFRQIAGNLKKHYYKMKEPVVKKQRKSKEEVSITSD